ncbi:hypothetical protein ACVWZM_004600 [Bradyrhizobium sp. USDA 4501]
MHEEWRGARLQRLRAHEPSVRAAADISKSAPAAWQLSAVCRLSDVALLLSRTRAIGVPIGLVSIAAQGYKQVGCRSWMPPFKVAPCF